MAIGHRAQLRIVSVFRSVHHQAEIIDEKKKKGLSEREIYKVSVPPGFREH